MFTIILTFLIGVYVLVIPFKTGMLGWSKTEISDKGTKLLKKVHLALLLLLLALWFLASKEIYLRGYWTTKILFWVFFCSAVLFYAFGKKEIQTKAERKYFGIFFWFPISLIPLFFLIPYLIFALIFYIGPFMGNKSDVLYSDSRYRIQRTYAGEANYRTSLFVKRGLFEFKEKPLRVSAVYKSNLDSITVKEFAEDSLRLNFYFKPNYSTQYPYVLAIKCDN